MSFTDGEQEAFEEQLEDTSIKALLIDQTAQLRAIRHQLEMLTGENTPRGESETQVYECKQCSAKVEGSDLSDHLEQDHRAPNGVKPEPFFEAV